MKKNNRRSVISIMLATLFAAMWCVVLSGCTLIDSIFDFDTTSVEFTRRSIVLEAGESYDLSQIIEANGDYELSSSNRSVATISGTNLNALSAGKCTITARAGRSSSTLGVTVEAHVPETIAIDYDGALIQTSGATSPITFRARTTGFSDSARIVWSVDGILNVVGNLSVPFVYEPTQIGKFTVTAEEEETELSASETVLVYRAIDATGHVDGELEQTAPSSPLTLTAQFTSDPENPKDTVCWRVDGKPVYVGSDRSFVYSPELGSHTLTLEVNGVRRDIDGLSSVALRVAGSVTPKIEKLEYDNLFPHALLVYDAIGAACVEITSPDGTMREYSQTSPQYADMFRADGIDVGGLVDVCASSSARRAYKFRVRSLGDGDAFLPSAYSDYYTFTQLPNAADKYLRDVYCDKDKYITSDSEFVNLLEYEIINRPKTSSTSSVSFDCYIGYTLAGSDEDLWNNAFEIAATSGRYTSISVGLRNNIYSVSFKVNTVNTPSKQTYNGFNDDEYTEQLHAILPHINYDADKYRESDHVFAIDLREREQSVKYTDELYFAAENNACPVPVPGSAAETVYEQARAVMRRIVSDDMTDMEKAHAVYDWIMWQVTYDTPATEITDDGEAYSAYYLEGVFGDGKTRVNGVRYSPYAVCDGISKAYSLMCNIEGIPCVRVSGIAGDSLADARGYGHAWNKVFVNGGWYVVDCTWGDVQSRIRINGTEREYELALHDHLFLTDEQADVTHFEAYESGDSDIIYAPVSSERRIDVYETMRFGDATVDCTVKKHENERERVAEIAAAFAENYTQIRSLYVPGGVSDCMYTIDYQAFEIRFDSGVPSNDSQIRLSIQQAIKAEHPSADVVIRSFDDIVLVLVK